MMEYLDDGTIIINPFLSGNNGMEILMVTISKYSIDDN